LASGGTAMTEMSGTDAVPGYGAVSAGLGKFSTFAHAPSPDTDGFGFMAGGRLYFSGPSGTEDNQGYVTGNVMWSAKVDFDATVDDDGDRMVNFGTAVPVSMVPGGGGRPVLSDYKKYDRPNDEDWIQTLLYDETHDSIDDYLWNIAYVGTVGAEWVIENFQASTGNRLAFETYADPGTTFSGWYPHMFALSPTEALFVISPNYPDGVTTWVKCVISGQSINFTLLETMSFAEFDAIFPSAYRYPAIYCYQRESGIGLTIVPNGSTYPNGDNQTNALTWRYDGNSITIGNPIEYTDTVSAAIGIGSDGAHWIPEYYNYGNTKRLSDGTHVDLAYKDFYDYQHPWNAVFTFQWDMDAIEVLQWAYVPRGGHPVYAEQYLNQHVIGWGMGEGNAVAFDDSSGTLKMFYDSGYAHFGGPDNISDYNHKLLTDPFGAALIDNLTTWGGDEINQEPPIGNLSYQMTTYTDPVIPDKHVYADFWTGGFFFEDGYVGLRNNYFLSYGWTASDGTVSPDAYNWVSPVPGYPLSPAWNGPLIARVISGQPNLDGGIIEKRKKFAAPPTAYNSS